MDSFPYIQKLARIRQRLVDDPTRPDPSWVRVTTITMISKFLQEIDLKKFKEKFKELGSVTVRRKGSRFRGFEWKMKDTAFYNQVTIGYEDAYSRKSIKIFGNGAIQVAGCSDLFDCRRILKQLSFILASVLELESLPPVADADVKMINTNFSLNSSVNLNKIIAALGSSANQARINYLDERISVETSILEDAQQNTERLAAGAYSARLDKNIALIEETEKSLEALVAERQSLGNKMPEGKFKVTFDPDRYSAVKIKFVPGPGMKQVTASVFSTGKIIVTGAQTLDEIAQAYKILNENMDPTIFVKPVANPELFGTVMGATFEEWVRVLENKHIELPKPVKRTEPSRASDREQELMWVANNPVVELDYGAAYKAFYALEEPTSMDAEKFIRVIERAMLDIEDQDTCEDLMDKLYDVHDGPHDYDLEQLKIIADIVRDK